MTEKFARHLGIVLGALYGLGFRLLWELEALQSLGSLVTLSFMFLVPFVIGFIRIYCQCRVTPSLSYTKMITLAWQPIFVFLLVSVVTLLEGSICVAMALPAFMLCASLGGLAAGLCVRLMHRKKHGALFSIVVLPVIVAPLELHFLTSSATYVIEDSIDINAPATAVWRQLATVSTIESNELPTTFASLIGVPKPIAADMSGQGVGAVRTSHWQKQVQFNEVITSWVENQQMTYRFDIDPERIPDNALDKHVKLGGKYFAPLDGGYFIEVLDSKRSRLTLRTRVEDNTHFGLYSRLWGEVIFHDFHTSLLQLMKTRAQADVAEQQS